MLTVWLRHSASPDGSNAGVGKPVYQRALSVPLLGRSVKYATRLV